MNVTPHQPEDLRELRRRIRCETNAKQRDRYRAVLLALEGRLTAVIMDKLARSKNFVQRWVYVYRDVGLEAVRAAKPPGITPKLPRDQESIFLERLGKAGRILRGRDIVEILEQEFGACYTLQGAYDLLHRLGYEPLKPRPINPKKKVEEEDAWKQAAPFLSRPSKTNSPAGRSRCGSRTNADSDKRDA